MRKMLWIPFLVLAADQLTKAWARTLTAPITVLPGILQLRLCGNTGMAFSLLSGNPMLLSAGTVLLLIGGWLILRRAVLGPVSRAAAMLILGGAVSNLIDRLFLGSVTDMIEVLFVRFAVFNVADAAVVIGCGLMAISLLACPKEWEKRP